MVELGYDNMPRNWYYQKNTSFDGFDPKNVDEECLDELSPSGDKDVFKSHLERGGVESERPKEVMIVRREGDSFYRECYKRVVDDLNTADVDLNGLRDSSYFVEVCQGNGSASAHRIDSIDFEDLPDNVIQIFKTHDDCVWKGES